MNTLVWTTLAAAPASLIIAIATMIVATHTPDTEHEPIVHSTIATFWAISMWTVALGFTLMLAPVSWFGRSWTFFKHLPTGTGGLGMGIVCVMLGMLQVVVLAHRGPHIRAHLALLLFLNGFVYWTAAIVLATAGMLGHYGFMEAPFMMYAGAHLYAQSAALWVHHNDGDPPR